MLRASGQLNGEDVDLRAVTEGEGAVTGVAHGKKLVAFSDAVVKGTDDELAAARNSLLRAVGPEAFVDSAAVAANFMRMVRIADGIGIALDPPLEMLSGSVRDELELGRFAASANTEPAGALQQVGGVVMRGVLGGVTKTVGAARRLLGR